MDHLAAPQTCQIRKSISEAVESFRQQRPHQFLHVVIDPRLPDFLPSPSSDLTNRLLALLAAVPERKVMTLVVYEMDDPAQSILRFQIEGSSLSFELTRDAVPPAEHPNAIPISILVAEDNPTNQNLAIDCLAQLGYSCDVVPNGLAAVEAVRNHDYGLIFMDIHMPLMDGLMATRTIRSLPRGGRPYIAALTAYTLPGDKARCYEAGMDDYLPKPCRISGLASVVKKAQNRHA